MGNSLGNMIRHYRKRCGLTQEKLGELCGVTPSCVSRWENDNLLEEDEKEFFLNSLRQYIAMKAKHNSK